MSCETSYLLMITIAAPSCVTHVSTGPEPAILIGTAIVMMDERCIAEC